MYGGDLTTMGPRRASDPLLPADVTASTKASATHGPARTHPACRLYGLVARDARTAVVFRRGPSKRVRRLRWDLATDAVTPGQWLAGRIYTRAGVTLERSTLGMGEGNGPFTVYRYRLLVASSGRAKEPGPIDLGRLDWADWDHDGALLFANDGCLYRRDVSAGAVDPPRVKRVADLRDQVFENVRAPDEARRWP